MDRKEEILLLKLNKTTTTISQVRLELQFTM